MINPVREVYEMEFRQQDLTRELENNRRVKAVMGLQAGRPSHILATIRNWGHVLGQLRKIRVEVSFHLEEPCPDTVTQ